MKTFTLNRFVRGAGIAWLAFLGSCCVMFGVMAFVGRGLDAQSKAFVDSVVPVVASHWDPDVFLARASPEYKAVMTSEDTAKLMHMASELGKLKSYDGSRGEATLFFDTHRGLIKGAQYLARATFENGPAEILVSLTMHHETWQISGIRVNSRYWIDHISTGASPKSRQQASLP